MKRKRLLIGTGISTIVVVSGIASAVLLSSPKQQADTHIKTTTSAVSDPGSSMSSNLEQIATQNQAPDVSSTQDNTPVQPSRQPNQQQEQAPAVSTPTSVAAQLSPQPVQQSAPVQANPTVPNDTGVQRVAPGLYTQVSN